MPKYFSAIILVFLGLGGCKSGGGTVLPSINGEMALAKACSTKPLDIIPNPIAIHGFHDKTQNGSPGMVMERFIDGFLQIQVTISAEQIAAGAALLDKDSGIWGIRPLANMAGNYDLKVAEIGDTDCISFEEILNAQGDPKAMDYLIDNRFPDKGARNWCISSIKSDQTMEFEYSSEVSSEAYNGAHLNKNTETINRNGVLYARRISIWLSQPSFPIGVNTISKDCDGNAPNLPPLYGKSGLVLRPQNSPYLLPHS